MRYWDTERGKKYWPCVERGCSHISQLVHRDYYNLSNIDFKIFVFQLENVYSSSTHETEEGITQTKIFEHTGSKKRSKIKIEENEK